MRTRAVVGAVASFVLAISPLLGGAAFAQGTSAADRDAAELKNYRLTMVKIRQLGQAGAAIAKAAQADPRYQAEKALDREIETLEKKEQLTAAEEKRLEELRAKKEAAEAEADAKEPGQSKDESLDETARRIEREPAFAGAIRSAGLTPREYALVSMVTFQAMLAHSLQKSLEGKELPKEAAAGVLAENIKFVADNEAEITRLLQQLQTLERKPQ